MKIILKEGFTASAGDTMDILQGDGFIIGSFYDMRLVDLNDVEISRSLYSWSDDGLITFFGEVSAAVPEPLSATCIIGVLAFSFAVSRRRK